MDSFVRAAVHPAGKRVRDAGRVALMALDATLTAATDILSQSLVDSSGEHAGRVSDVMINRYTGRIDFVQVAVEPVGSEQRFIAVPWSIISPPANDSQPWVIRARRDTLRKMARFETGL